MLTTFKKKLQHFQNFSTNLLIIAFLNGKSYFEVRTVSPIWNFDFLFSRSGLLYRMEKELELLAVCGITSFSKFLWNSSLWRFETICERTCTHIFLYDSKEYVSRSFFTFNKCTLSVTHCRVVLYSFSFPNFRKIFKKFLFPCWPPFPGVDSFFLSQLKKPTSLDELVDTLHCYYFWPVCQHMPSPHINLHLWIFNFLGIRCGQSTFCKRSFWIQKTCHLIYWLTYSFWSIVHTPMNSTTLGV